MARDGIAGFESKQLIPAAFTGFRSWAVNSVTDPALWSVTYRYGWEQGVNEAACMTSRKTCDCEPRHTPSYPRAEGCVLRPDTCDGVKLECGCGFWAYDHTENWFAQNYGASGGVISPVGGGGIGSTAIHVVGVVYGFGRMVIGTKGFRAQKAVIAGLVMPPRFTARTWRAEDADAAALADQAVRAEQVEAGLRERYWSVPFYPTVEEMLATIPITPLGPLLDTGDTP